ncbi:caspase-8-like isoform X2 [Pollicipes pollicipes]|nr:caspase-8-like [Pollicipes pollicipes]XP_037071902.1 caspase-8-like [Pollicipes pollicipes]XP_037072680.1 caspase-8-like isoform X2 [Pollicipes pollicipes]
MMADGADFKVDEVFYLTDVVSEEGGWLLVDSAPESAPVTSDAVSFESTLTREDMCHNAIDVDDLPDIEKDLLPEDVVRLLFLAVDDLPAIVLQKCVVRMNRETGGKAMVDTFSNWARSSVSNVWKCMFLEALAVIGRLDVLETLGLEKEQMRKLQKPVYLSSLKVALNTVCCHLLQEDVKRLVEYISRSYLPGRQSPIFPDGCTIKQLLELYILYWMQERVIDLTDLSVLAEGLVHLSRHDLKDVLSRETAESAITSTAPSSGNHSKVVDLSSIGDALPPKIYANSKGVCVIFNQERFACQDKECVLGRTDNHGMRLGSSIDAENLEKTFQEFGCRTKIFNNLKETEIRTCLERLSCANDLKNFDYLVTCFLSHGGTSREGEHFIYSSDCKTQLLDDLVSCFGADLCGALAGKLKIVVTQACQGIKALPVVSSDGPEDVPMSSYIPTPAPASRTTPLSDFLFCQATTPGFKAYRDTHRGSFYIIRLCQVLRARGHLEEITCCIKDVHNVLTNNPIQLGNGRNQPLLSLQPQMIDRTTGRFTFKKREPSCQSR